MSRDVPIVRLNLHPCFESVRFSPCQTAFAVIKLKYTTTLKEVVMAAVKKILVPTDFSKFSDSALKQAVEMAKQYKAKIYLFHVIHVVQQCTEGYCFDDATVENIEQQSTQSSLDMMQKQIRRVVKSSDVDILSDVRKGTPYQEILKEQQDKKIDLIVIATHGRTGLIGYLLGSVAEKVTRHATCPVFLVRGK
jgi:universal stress protein A